MSVAVTSFWKSMKALARAGSRSLGSSLSVMPEPVRSAVTVAVTASPAARAGLQPNDVITQFAGEPITSRDDLIRVVGATPVGSEVDVVYYRNQRQFSTKVTLNERFETAAARARNGGNGLKSLIWRDVLLVEPTEQFLMTKTGSTTKPGLFVAEVPRKSTLFRRGLREDSLIVAVDGTRVRTFDDLLEAEKAGREKLRIEVDSGEVITIMK